MADPVPSANTESVKPGDGIYPLTGARLRAHAAAPRLPAWEGQARQLLNWAADCLDAAERVIQESRQ